jgi:multicomponent Na+:H+ antiporter subunit E
VHRPAQCAAYNEAADHSAAPQRGPAAVFRSFSLFFALCLFWLLLSGFFTAFLLAAGIGSALAVLVLAHRMRIVDDEGHPIHLALSASLYWLWLAKEIVKSAWLVSKLILHPKLPISPTLVRFRPTQRGDVALVIHANSITLTPGTITIEATAQEFLVHGITRESAAAVIDSEMDRRISRVEDSSR